MLTRICLQLLYMFQTLLGPPLQRGLLGMRLLLQGMLVLIILKAFLEILKAFCQRGTLLTVRVA